MRALMQARAVLERVLEVIAVLLIATLAVLVMLAVVYRAARSPLVWYDEMASVLLAWVTYYGAALAALKRAHLGFPNVMAALPPAVRLPLTVLAEAIVIGFFAVAAWYGWQVVVLLEGDYMISLRWLPIPLVQSVIPIGAALFVVAELMVLPDRLIEAARSAPPVEQHIPVPTAVDGDAEVGR